MATVAGGRAVNRWLADNLDRPDRSLSVGFMEGATYPDGTSVALIAAINEFGAPSRGQPPRPFMRNVVREDGPQWGKDIAAIFKATGKDVEQTLELMGPHIQGQIQDSIRNFTDPPLSPRTIRRKGFDSPLRDTGHMLNSVTYKVT